MRQFSHHGVRFEGEDGRNQISLDFEKFGGTGEQSRGRRAGLCGRRLSAPGSACSLCAVDGCKQLAGRKRNF
jgi:hypothetical protein